MLTHFSISQQGKRHIEKNVPCQDFSASKRIDIDRFGSEIVIAAVADGVGSCEYSQFGSSTAVQSFLYCIEHNIQNKLSELSDETIIELIKHSFNYALSQVEKEAEERKLPFLEFDSTLTGIVYDGHTLWYGHIGDDGVVVLYSDGKYEMITKRHKGEEAHSLFPLRESDLWQFGKSLKEIASCALMTDGVLDHCVDVEGMGNRVYFPFLEPALTETILTDEDAERQRLDWDEYLSGKGNYSENFRDKVTDDISLVVVQNPDIIKDMPPVQFDFDKWDEDTAKRKKELDDVLYADYRAYKAGIYQSPVKHAAGYCLKNTYSNTITPHKILERYPDEQFIKHDKAILEQADEKGTADIGEAVKDTLKNTCRIGKAIRKQLIPKRKRHMSDQEQSVMDENKESGSACITSVCSNAQLKMQSKDMTVDGKEENGRIKTDEQ